ncbi:MAG: LysR family transcriptional regulator [Deltaproteobacteria bacterium]|nr:LysR family transcriptional regulator [Deltaproteobacteria bacterium]
MHVTLDHARTLDALARAGTLQAAARELHKSHTSVLHALRGLEAQTELDLLDRSGYRLKLTSAGLRVLEHCRRLLASERALTEACLEMRTGWEPSLRIVFDGVVSSAPLLEAVGALVKEGAATRISVSGEFLGGVEEAFERDEADLMITVLPPRREGVVAKRLAPIRALLVAHRGHSLARSRRPLSREDLAAHVLLTVRGGDPRLELPTQGIEPRGTIALADFEAKKRALVAGIGFGWIPEHVAARELARRELRVLGFEGGSEHTFQPRLYHRQGARLGRAARRVVEALT